MSTVVRFPRDKIAHPQPKPHTLMNLGGKRPPGHPETLMRDHNGLIVLVVGQVWVAKKGGRLWRLTNVTHNPTLGAYPHSVALTPLTGRPTIRPMSELILRQTMLIWDDAIAGLHQMVRQRANHPFKRTSAFILIVNTRPRPP